MPDTLRARRRLPSTPTLTSCLLTVARSEDRLSQHSVHRLLLPQGASHLTLTLPPAPLRPSPASGYARPSGGPQTCQGACLAFSTMAPPSPFTIRQAPRLWAQLNLPLLEASVWSLDPTAAQRRVSAPEAASGRREAPVQLAYEWSTSCPISATIQQGPAPRNLCACWLQ